MPRKPRLSIPGAIHHVMARGIEGRPKSCPRGHLQDTRRKSIPVPNDDEAYCLVELVCIPGASFRNQTFVGEQCAFAKGFDYNLKMLMFDPQTSGGLLFSVEHDKAEAAVAELRKTGHSRAAIVGRVVSRTDRSLYVRV